MEPSRSVFNSPALGSYRDIELKVSWQKNLVSSSSVKSTRKATKRQAEDEPQSYKLHKVLLAHSSPFFHGLFGGSGIGDNATASVIHVSLPGCDQTWGTEFEMRTALDQGESVCE